MFEKRNVLFDNIHITLRECNEYLRQEDIKGFLMNLRISAELVCKFIIVSEKKAREFEDIFLIELSKRFKGNKQKCTLYNLALYLNETKIIPFYIYYLIEFIRKSCNEPAHNVLSQEEEKYLFTPNKSSYNNIFYWFFKAYLKQDIPLDVKDFLNDYKIKNSFSLFLIPFVLNTKKLSFPDFYNQLEQSIWQPLSKKEMLNEYVLYNHIDKFLRANNDCKSFDNMNPYTILSFKLKDNIKIKKSQLLKHLFFNNKHAISEIDIEFSLVPSGELCPALHFIPCLSIFFISFGLCIETKNHTLQKIIDFNYLLRGLEWNGVGIKTNKNPHPNARKNNTIIEEFLTNELNVHFKHKALNQVDNTDFVWNMNQFMDFLLIDFPEDSLNQILPYRFHIFTFARSMEQIPKSRLPKLMTLIASVYNSNFYPTKSFIANNLKFSHPFEQIYYASSNEGAIVLQNDDKEYNVPFFDDFQSMIENRYVWVYKYIFLQKLMLLHGIDKLSGVNDENALELTEAVKDIKHILSTNDSNDISNVSSINQFYSIVRRGMGIRQLYIQLYRRFQIISAFSNNP